MFNKKIPIRRCSKKSKRVTKKSIETADIERLLEIIKENKLTENINEFDKSNEMNPTFKFLREYMTMIECLLRFIRSVRMGDWVEHLLSVEAVTGYFFALDLHNYSAMMALYVAEMQAMK